MHPLKRMLREGSLLEGYVLVIPGARGWNAKVTKPDGSTVYPRRGLQAL